MTQLFSNNALSLLSSQIGPTDLTIQVIPGDGNLYPQPTRLGDYFLVTLEDSTANHHEIVKCIDRVGDLLIVDPDGRGFEGTAPRTWPIDSLVDHRATAHFYNRTYATGETSDNDPANIVSPSAIKNANVFPTSYPNKLTCKWIVTVLDPATERVSVCEVLACYRGINNPPMFSVYAKTGDKLSYTIEVDASGTDLELNVHNTGTVPLQLNWVRINN